MYRVITYRSKLLKKTAYSIEELSAAGNPVADFDDFNEYEKNIDKQSKKAKKNKKEKKPKENIENGDSLEFENKERTYIIDGVEVNEEDLTYDEKIDMEANALLNGDGFYTPLLPLDYYERESKTTTEKKPNALLMGVVIFVTIAIVAGIVVAMMMLQ